MLFQLLGNVGRSDLNVHAFFGSIENDVDSFSSIAVHALSTVVAVLVCDLSFVGFQSVFPAINGSFAITIHAHNRVGVEIRHVAEKRGHEIISCFAGSLCAKHTRIHYLAQCAAFSVVELW